MAATAYGPECDSRYEGTPQVKPATRLESIQERAGQHGPWRFNTIDTQLSWWRSSTIRIIAPANRDTVAKRAVISEPRVRNGLSNIHPDAIAMDQSDHADSRALPCQQECFSI